MRRAFRLALVVALAADLAPGFAGEPQSKAGAEEIRQLIGQTFDRAQAPVATDPVVIEDDYAVAGWIQDTRGGRALLRQEGGRWRLLLCGGDALKSAHGLRGVGVPGATAGRLARALAAAEGSLPAGRRQRFASFRGTVPVAQGDPAGHAHSPSHHQP